MKILSFDLIASEMISGWCHVLCALYIPEAEFANDKTMEPIILSGIPHDRYSKVSFFVNIALILNNYDTYLLLRRYKQPTEKRMKSIKSRI